MASNRHEDTHHPHSRLHSPQQVDLLTGSYLLAYPCGCTIQLDNGHATRTWHCPDPGHTFLGQQHETPH